MRAALAVTIAGIVLVAAGCGGDDGHAGLEEQAARRQAVAFLEARPKPLTTKPELRSITKGALRSGRDVWVAEFAADRLDGEGRVTECLYLWWAGSVLRFAYRATECPTTEPATGSGWVAL